MNDRLTIIYMLEMAKMFRLIAMANAGYARITADRQPELAMAFDMEYEHAVNEAKECHALVVKLLKKEK